MTLTGTKLERLLRYDPASGHFHWRVGRKGTKTSLRSDRRAGCSDHEGYILICVDYRTYKAHRLAWLWMTGKWPKDEIDHINGIKSDNRFANLREATKSENMRYWHALRAQNGAQP